MDSQLKMSLTNLVDNELSVDINTDFNESVPPYDPSFVKNVVNQYFKSKKNRRITQRMNWLNDLKMNDEGQVLFLKTGQLFVEEFAPNELSKIYMDLKIEPPADGNLLSPDIWYLLDREKQILFNLLYGAMQQLVELRDDFHFLAREAFLSVEYPLRAGEPRCMLKGTELLVFILKLCEDHARSIPWTKMIGDNQRSKYTCNTLSDDYVSISSQSKEPMADRFSQNSYDSESETCHDQANGGSNSTAESTCNDEDAVAISPFNSEATEYYGNDGFNIGTDIDGIQDSRECPESLIAIRPNCDASPPINVVTGFLTSDQHEPGYFEYGGSPSSATNQMPFSKDRHVGAYKPIQAATCHSVNNYGGSRETTPTCPATDWNASTVPRLREQNDFDAREPAMTPRKQLHQEHQAISVSCSSDNKSWSGLPHNFPIFRAPIFPPPLLLRPRIDKSARKFHSASAGASVEY